MGKNKKKKEQNPSPYQKVEAQDIDSEFVNLTESTQIDESD